MANKLTHHQLSSLEERLSKYEGEDRIVSSEDLAKLLDVTSDLPSIASGIPSMDRILNKLEGGELVIVTGPTAHGKTTLLMSITANMAEKGVESAWFTLEVTPRQFIKKLLSATGKLPHFYAPLSNTENTVKWLIERIIEAKVKYDVKAVFIDHLHQIFSITNMQSSISLEIGDVVARIKQIALDYGIVIFLIAHNTDNKISPNAEPRMQDIRDSGMISRTADVVMGVWRVPNNATKDENRMKELGEMDTRAKVRIWKNRREGKVGTWLMDHKNHYLRELDDDWI